MNAHRASLFIASLLLVACGNTVIDGGGSSGGNVNQGGSSGEGGSTGQGGQGGSPETPEVHPAVSLTRAQIDVLWEKYWEEHGEPGTSSSSGGGNLDPNDLFLRLSDMGVHCGSPTVDLPCGGHYQMTIVLPPALQQVGVYDFEAPELVAYSSMSETGDLNSNDPEDCPWGGGSLGSGTVEILSIDDTEVHFKVNLSNGPWDSDPSGEYVAPRCPATP
jgi:hypothetical protein